MTATWPPSIASIGATTAQGEEPPAAEGVAGESPSSGEDTSPGSRRTCGPCNEARRFWSAEDPDEACRRRRRRRGRRPTREDAAAMGAPGRPWSARHEVRLRSRLLRGLHGADRRPQHEVLPDRDRARRGQGHHDGRGRVRSGGRRRPGRVASRQRRAVRLLPAGADPGARSRYSSRIPPPTTRGSTRG